MVIKLQKTTSKLQLIRNIVNGEKLFLKVKRSVLRRFLWRYDI